MTNTLQKKLYENGYSIVKNILDYRRDLKPVLNDMEFVMDCLIQKYAKRKQVKKVLKYDFRKKYSFISKLNIYDMDQYFNTRLPRDHVKKDSDYFNAKLLEKKLFPELCVLLNGYHDTHHDERFWSIIKKFLIS